MNGIVSPLVRLQAPRVCGPPSAGLADPKGNGGRGKGREGQASGSKDGGGNGNGGGAHQGMKRNYQPWGRTGGWKKDEWRDDWFSAKDGAAASSTDTQEVHKVLGMLQRLALRHEDSINHDLGLLEVGSGQSTKCC